MKKLSCTANKSVRKYMQYYSEGWHCIVFLMRVWNQEANQYQQKNVNNGIQNCHTI